MSPSIFIEDFERTESTDFLHGVIGRAIILTTRFDAMCNSLALAMNIRSIPRRPGVTDDEFINLVEAATGRHRTLKCNIDALGMPNDVAAVLHKARTARNAVAHDLTVGFTGCLDAKVDIDSFQETVSRLIEDIVDGDVIVCSLCSILNNEGFPNKEFFETYKSKALQWLVGR